MSAEWTSNLAEFEQRHTRAVDFALIAAAHVLVNALKRKFQSMQGYTTGQYRETLQRGRRITRSEPLTENGARMIRVGVLSGIPVETADGKKSKLTIGQIMLAWELGHLNLYSGNFERVEVFRPTLIDTATEIRETFARAYIAQMKAA